MPGNDSGYARPMDSGSLQTELDKRFATSASERAMMRAGQMPDALRGRLSKGWGCLRTIVTLLGAVAGAVFAWNVRTVVAPQVPLVAWAAGGAVLGAIITLVVFSTRFKATALDGKVLSDTGLMRLKSVGGTSASDSIQLVTADGLSVSALALRGFELPTGRYRVFYLNLGKADSEAFQAVGLEVA